MISTLYDHIRSAFRTALSGQQWHLVSALGIRKLVASPRHDKETCGLWSEVAGCVVNRPLM